MLSEKPSEEQNFQMRLKKSFTIHGKPRQQHDMKGLLKNGETVHFVVFVHIMVFVLHEVPCLM